MFKKIFLYSLFCMSFFASDHDKTKESSIATPMIIVYCVGGVAVVAGGVLVAPLILPTTTIVAMQASAAAAGTSIANAFVVAAPYAQGINFSMSAGRIVRPYVIQTTEEQLNQFLKKEADELQEVKTKLIACSAKNRSHVQRDRLGSQAACQDIAFYYAILAGENELNKVLKTTA